MALLLLSSWAVGCDGARGQALSAWTLQLDDSSRGISRAIELPVHLDDVLPKRVIVYCLTAKVDISRSGRRRSALGSFERFEQREHAHV